MGIHASPARLKRELASVSPMPSHPQKRDIADFFRPYVRDATPVVPQKRRSAFQDEDDEDDLAGSVTTARAPPPRTPGKTVTFKDVTPTPRSIRRLDLSLSSEASLPIRSPRAIRSGPPPQSQQRTLPRTSSPQTESSASETRPNLSFTFSDVSERSHNIIKDGILVAVRDSDEDTNSLESLDDIFTRNKSNGSSDITSSASTVDDGDSIEAERVKALSMFTNGRSNPIIGKDKLRALHAKERAIKFDLSQILNDHFGEEEAEAEIRRARESSEEEERDTAYTEADKQLLASIAQGADQEADSDDVSRLLNAVERTEALAGERSYHFFGDDRTDDTIRDEEPFPMHAIPHQLWQENDLEGRSRTYLSGIMAETAEDDLLAEDALRWTFRQIANEHRNDLRQAYIRTLEAGGPSWTRLNLTAADVQEVFQSLGASSDAVRDNTSIKPRHQPIRQSFKQHSELLISVLEIFTVMCLDMDMSSLSKLSSIVLRLTLDKEAMSDGRLSVAMENLITALLDIPDLDSVSHVYDRFLTDATRHVHDPSLQAQLLQHILPTSAQANRLRKTLADVFILGPSTIDPKTNTSAASLTDLSKHISTSSSFNLTRRRTSAPFDYVALSSLTTILDISIGSEPLSVLAPSEQSDTNPKLQKESIHIFNQSLDTLADQIHSLFVSIKDTGASHMRRTEAKDILQALYFRLLYSVRIGLRKKKHIFDFVGDHNKDNNNKIAKKEWIGRDGDVVREERKGGEFMKKFLDKAGLRVESEA